MTKECIICGRPFEAVRRCDKACPDPDCRKALYAEGVYRWKMEHIERNRQLNREYMARRRAKQKAEKAKAFTADGYADRQKQKTLAMVGRVEI